MNTSPGIPVFRKIALGQHIRQAASVSIWMPDEARLQSGFSGLPFPGFKMPTTASSSRDTFLQLYSCRLRKGRLNMKPYGLAVAARSGAVAGGTGSSGRRYRASIFRGNGQGQTNHRDRIRWQDAGAELLAHVVCPLRERAAFADGVRARVRQTGCRGDGSEWR